MIIRSFLMTFSILALLNHPHANAAIGADEIWENTSAFLSAHTENLRQQLGKEARIEYRIGTLDPRLAMADCSAPLAMEINKASAIGRVNVKVSCTQGTLWSIYIPAAIDVYRPIVVATAPISKGSQITAQQLGFREMNISRINGEYFTVIDSVAGMQARRAITIDIPVLANQLEPPIIIKKGDAVIMTANSGTLYVKTPGIAMADGRKGEQISVRNRSSKRIVEARVTGPGQVEVVM